MECVGLMGREKGREGEREKGVGATVLPLPKLAGGEHEEGDERKTVSWKEGGREGGKEGRKEGSTLTCDSYIHDGGREGGREGGQYTYM